MGRQQERVSERRAALAADRSDSVAPLAAKLSWTYAIPALALHSASAERSFAELQRQGPRAEAVRRDACNVALSTAARE